MTGDDAKAAPHAGVVAIVGTGLVGQSWAMLFARAGWQTRLHDPVPGAAAQALRLCEAGLQMLSAHGLCDEPAAAMARITVHTALAEALDGADFVQESGPERIEVKRATFVELDRCAAPDAVLASSTSGLPCSSWSEGLPGRRRCLVGHPVNPPHLIPLVEIVPAPWTADEVVARARHVYGAIGQSPIVLRHEIAGFVLNRLQAALLAEAFRLVRDGIATPADVDACVAQGLGARWSFMGPFETIDLNAPGGLTDYVERFRAFLTAPMAPAVGPDVFSPTGVAAIMAQWQGLPDRSASAARRDGMLAKWRREREVGVPEPRASSAPRA